MMLIVGGESQGKLRAALRLTGLKESDAADGGSVISDEIEKFPLINNLHLLTYSILKNGKTVDGLREKLNGKTVICNEIGCGIVPIDQFERRWREETGRLCCDLARDADKVFRVHCGILQCIKGAP